MAKDAKALAAKFQRLAKTTERVNRGAVTKAAQAGKSIAQREMSAKGVTPGKKLKVGRAVNVFYTVKGGADAAATIALRGPAQLVNNPTQAHRIEPRKRSGRRHGGKKALTIGQNLRASANHPGTKGKKFWEASEAEMRRKLPEVVKKTHRDNWIKELSG